jgi:hypothetical protein
MWNARHFTWTCTHCQSGTTAPAHSLLSNGSFIHSVSFGSCFLKLCAKSDTRMHCYLLPGTINMMHYTNITDYLSGLCQTEWLQRDVTDCRHPGTGPHMLRKSYSSKKTQSRYFFIRPCNTYHSALLLQNKMKTPAPKISFSLIQIYINLKELWWQSTQLLLGFLPWPVLHFETCNQFHHQIRR